MIESYGLISDLDDTLLGDHDALVEFARYHERHRDRLALAYASGRTTESLARVIQSTPLPAPDMIVAAVGTDIRRYPDLATVTGWHERVSPRWNADRIREVLGADDGLVPQPDSEQSAYKVSYYIEGAVRGRLRALSARLEAAGLEADLVYSSNRDLDFLPPGVNKGTAAAYVAALWGLPHDRVFVAGNSGNDIDLFRHGFLGIVVANAHEELKALAGPRIHVAAQSHARGVVAGMGYWIDRLAQGPV
ncbi:MAG: HAD-IIB family hydrolase [Planctomycetes bacterium]|nr:HAD-IIB family hydrolase [Planctomycetota bacterium]